MADTPPTTEVSLNYAFVPIGFDDNDKIEIMVAGIFPSTCHKVGPYDFRVDESSRSIFIEQKAYVYPGQCLRMMVPFTSLINLKIIKDGNYSLRDAKTGELLGELPVTRATVPEADEHLYAQVKDAYIHTTEDAKTELHLKGVFASRCMKIQETKVGYHKDVIVVQPILERTAPIEQCGNQMTRFHIKKELKKGLKGTQLLHVRVMDGKSINQLVELP